jgi:hypothetical protein
MYHFSIAASGTDRAKICRKEKLPLGYVVGQLVEELQYKPEGRGFVSLCGHWDFFDDLILPRRAVAVGSTQPLRKMSISLGVKAVGAGCHRVSIVKNPGTLNLLQPEGPIQGFLSLFKTYPSAFHVVFTAVVNTANAEFIN